MPLAERKIEVIATGPEVVERINAILAEKKIPKMQFYRACGITPGAYSQWKAGLTSPALKTLNKVASFLHVELTDLMFTPAKPTKQAKYQTRKRRAGVRYLSPATMRDRTASTVIQDAKDRYGIMFDTSKGATEEEILATIAFLRTLREQRSADED